MNATAIRTPTIKKVGSSDYGHVTAPALRIRYANPDSTPGQYPSRGWTRTDTVMTDDYWTIRGPVWALTLHVMEALNDNNVNDYTIGDAR